MTGPRTDTVHLPPLADLHRHLDGSMRRSTLDALAAEAGVRLPHRLAFHAGMGLDAALACFAVTLSVLQTPEAVRRVAAEMCEDAAQENVTTLEIRFAPQLHQGGDVADIVDAALEGIAGRAGLVLCGLYGEPPEVLADHVALAARRPGVVGIDLAGGPTSDDRWALTDYAAPFALARELGVGRTVHAGEGRPPQEIAVAVHRLHAQRIGHGTTLLQDPKVAALVLERRVTLEACVTSNHQVGAIRTVDEHPLPLWLSRGLRACICVDNTLLSQVDAPEEHRRVLAIEGMTPALLAQAVAHGHAAAFSRT